MKNAIKVFAPATIANLGIGFDHLGLAIYGPGDEIIIGEGSEKGLKIKEIKGAKGRLPIDPTKNTAGVAALSLLEAIGAKDYALEMSIHKKMPIGSGLGSSAASAVAGVFAVHKYLRTGLDVSELLPHAVKGEQIASGAKHADNVAPSLLGGMVYIRDNQTLDYKRIYFPKGIFFAVVYPEISILTRDARSVLSKSVSLENAIQQAANFAGFVTAANSSDLDLMARCLDDRLIEHQRASLIPYFNEMKEIAMNKGAMGFSISGAGPSVFAMCFNQIEAENIAEKLQSFLKGKKIQATTWVSDINNDGAYLF